MLVHACRLGNCNIDLFNFRHRQVCDFKILNQFERDQNLAVNFWKYQKRKRKSTKYIVSERKQSLVSTANVKLG